MQQRLDINRADNVIVLDFETTGLSPDHGDRAIEIGAVKIEDGQISGRFQQLMNPGRRINSFIESYTGISNEMIKDAPPCAEAMDSFANFIAGFDLVAHNASFDKRFLDAELQRINRNYTGRFVCSMLAARRLYQKAPNHKLETLIRYRNIPVEGSFHRALADSEMTGRLWLKMLRDIEDEFQICDVPFELMQKLARTPKAAAHKMLREWT